MTVVFLSHHTFCVLYMPSILAIAMASLFLQLTQSSLQGEEE